MARWKNAAVGRGAGFRKPGGGFNKLLPLAVYRFDEQYLTIAQPAGVIESCLDSSGNGSAPMINPNVGYQPDWDDDGVNGRGCALFGTPDYLYADGIASNFSNSNPISTFTVFKDANTAASNQSFYSIGRSGGGANDNPYHFIDIGGSSPYEYRIKRRDTSATPAYAITTGVDADTNVHVMCERFDGTNEWICIDGVATSVNNTSIASSLGSADRFSMGALRRSTTMFYFEGRIAFFAVFNRFLTADEVAYGYSILNAEYGA